MRGEFYKMDFRAWNRGTVDLTLEQEAAYLRLCHAMYDAGGPIPESTRLLQGIFRCGNVKAAALVRQLIEARKIERLPDGRLTNRRVAQELGDRERISEMRRTAGGHGGSARRVNTECGSGDPRATVECSPSEERVNPSKTLENQQVAEASASTMSPKIREEKSITPVIPKGTEPEGFAEFRAVYPKRSTAFPATQARKRWLEARKRGAEPAEIVAGARAYAAEQQRIGKVGTEFVQTADVWLNKQRWRDYAESDLAPKLFTEPVAAIADDVWRDRVRIWRARSGYWPWRPSPPPDDPRTAVPRHVLAEFDLPPRSQAAA